MTVVATGAVPMIELWRGGLLESTHAGHAVIWGPDGIEDSWGDPAAVIFPRSSCKMIQALPLIETGAADALGLTPAHLAFACASHQGEARHVKLAGDWLSAIGLSEPDLRCGAHEPYDRDERNRLIKTDTSPCQLHNNCSGKHAGFVCLGCLLARQAGTDPAAFQRWLAVTGVWVGKRE